MPGRPGDGFVGSHSPIAAEPTCSPDDVQDNDGDLFCGEIMQMADGCNILVGGADWHNEPALWTVPKATPRLSASSSWRACPSPRIFDPDEDRWAATTFGPSGRPSRCPPSRS